MSLDQWIAKFIENGGLLSSESRLLVATSGGVDSMCLLYALQRQGYQLGVAHINYKLRHIDSTHDQELVEKYCKKYSLPFYCHIVNDEESQQLANTNLQQTAREIRYTFFEKIRVTEKFDFIVTAHHKNDQVETFFLNALRGSGLNGLKGIKEQNGNRLRPLLSVSKKEIIEYAENNSIPYRLDTSNDKNDYNRNFLRNEIIPRLEERWPNLISTVTSTSKLLGDEQSLLDYLMRKESSQWIIEEGELIRIGPISKLRNIPGHQSFFRFLTRLYGLSTDSIASILNPETISGADFSNPQYQIILDRDFLLIQCKTEDGFKTIEIKNKGSFDTNSGQLTLTSCEKLDPNKKPNEEYLDQNRMQFPLLLRLWKKGDRWQPLGMKGHKLISDTLIDKKVDLFSKERTHVIEDQSGEIVWISNVGISENAKITNSTKDIIKISWDSIV